MTQDMITLEYDKIIELLTQQAISAAAKERLSETRPIMNEELCAARMEETTAALRVLNGAGLPPLSETEGTQSCLDEAVRGGMLLPGQLSEVMRFCTTVRRLSRYLEGVRAFSAGIASRCAECPDLSETEEEIGRSVREDSVLDDASPALRDLRRRRERAETEVREKLNRVLLHHRAALADGYITERNGCYVVPVLKRFQSTFPGRVVDTSSKGNTVFMEPSAVRELREELDRLAVETDAEERRILWALSDRVASQEAAFRDAIRVMADVDALFARAKLSEAMGAGPVRLTAERHIRLVKARHPLLSRETCVPLDLELGFPDTGIAVTGPNTGGKTVCLKTVGLLTLMAQSGLHIPCAEGTEICMADRVLCNIGDSQSISQNLSTFSGHMTNMIRILEQCSRDSLVLLDEPGSGTDPAEGSGIAAAVLTELTRRRCFFMVTTHDPQIKQWAEQTEHVISARMAFDKVSLQPLYRLEMGLSGESCAIEIARRLGMDEGLLFRAKQAAERGVMAAAESDGHKAMHVPGSLLRRAEKAGKNDFCRFDMGDSVALLPEHKTAIVYRPADDNGNVIIQLQGKKLTVRHNRLRLLVPASELYPPDYDFSIIFDTVANRKAAHTISRKYDAGAQVVLKEGTEDRKNDR